MCYTPGTTGDPKILKTALRDQFKRYTFSNSAPIDAG